MKKSLIKYLVLVSAVVSIASSMSFAGKSGTGTRGGGNPQAMLVNAEIGSILVCPDLSEHSCEDVDCGQNASNAVDIQTILDDTCDKLEESLR